MDVKVKFLGKTFRTPALKASKGERAVAAVLDKHGIPYTMQHPFGYMHIDFCVEIDHKQYFIEYDGQQHYRPVSHFGGIPSFIYQRIRDLTEGWECKDRGIPLLRIKYTIPLDQLENLVLAFLRPDNNITSSVNNHFYPVILKPSGSKSPILPNTSSKKRRHKVGPSELVALYRIDHIVGEQIKSSVPVRLGGHSYEPDMVYLDKAKGICIDIEIDEPYSAGNLPIHFLLPDGSNKDSLRNQNFIDAGWHVVRFSEEQMYCHTASCVKVIYQLLLDLGAIDFIPDKVAKVPNLLPQPRWTERDSWGMIRTRFRRTYLKFDPSNIGLKGVLVCFWQVLPIFFRSLTRQRIRNELCNQLKGFVWGR